MDKMDLFAAVSEIDDDVLERSENEVQRIKSPIWIKWGSLAACVCIVVAGIVALPKGTFNGPHIPSPPPAQTTNSPSPQTTNPMPTDSPTSPPIQTNPGDPSVSIRNFNEFDKAVGGGETFFYQKYKEETYNIAFLRTHRNDTVFLLSEGELDRWVNDVFLKKSDNEMNETPTLYQAVHELNISKESLTILNESRKGFNGMVLDDALIDALYYEEEDMKKTLMNPLALYFEGEIYTWGELKRMIAAGTLPDGIAGSFLQEYVDNTIAYCIENKIIPENVISRYFDVNPS